MEELVFLQSITQEPYTTDKVIADHSDNSLKAVRNLIRDKKERLEKYGVFRFEIVKPKRCDLKSHLNTPANGQPTSQTHKYIKGEL